MQNRVEIDNPGAGDCGFFAFANGLIEIIQQDPKSVAAKRIIELLANVQPSTGAGDKTDSSERKKLKNALLATPFITKKNHKIKINLPVDDEKDIPQGGYSLDEFLVKRLRALAVNHYFNAYNTTEFIENQKRDIYSANRKAINLSSNHEAILKKMQEVASAYMLYLQTLTKEQLDERKQEIDIRVKNRKNKVDFAQKAARKQFLETKQTNSLTEEEWRQLVEQLQKAQDEVYASITGVERELWFYDSIILKVFEFQGQIESKQENDFLEIYAEEHIKETLISRKSGTFNEESANLSGSLLFVATSLFDEKNNMIEAKNSQLELILQEINAGKEQQKLLGDEEAKKREDKREDIRENIVQQIADKNYYSNLEKSTVVADAISLFDYISRQRKNESLSEDLIQKTLFYYDRDFKRSVTDFYESFNKKHSRLPTQQDFIRAFFEEGGAFNKNLKSIKKKLKQSSYRPNQGGSVSLMDVSLLTSMAQAFNIEINLSTKDHYGREHNLLHINSEGPDKEKIYITNIANYHWTSRHSHSSTAYSQPKYHSVYWDAPKNGAQSVRSIKDCITAVLKRYINSPGWFSCFKTRTRHHINVAKNLLGVIENTKDPHTIIRYMDIIYSAMEQNDPSMLKSLSFENTINRNGDFYAAMKSIVDNNKNRCEQNKFVSQPTQADIDYLKKQLNKKQLKEEWIRQHEDSQFRRRHRLS